MHAKSTTRLSHRNRVTARDPKTDKVNLGCNRKDMGTIVAEDNQKPKPTKSIPPPHARIVADALLDKTSINKASTSLQNIVRLPFTIFKYSVKEILSTSYDLSDAHLSKEKMRESHFIAPRSQVLVTFTKLKKTTKVNTH